MGLFLFSDILFFQYAVKVPHAILETYNDGMPEYWVFEKEPLFRYL